MESKTWRTSAEKAKTETIEKSRQELLGNLAQEAGMPIDDLRNLRIEKGAEGNEIHSVVNGVTVEINMGKGDMFSPPRESYIDGFVLSPGDTIDMYIFLKGLVEKRDGINVTAEDSTIKQIDEIDDYERRVGTLRDRVFGKLNKAA